MDFLIVGLGNPGPKYEKSHHNAGFLALDHLAQQLGCPVTRAKFQALTGQAELCGHKVLLMKPQTFMNLSGNAVGAAARFYHLTPDRVLVIYDDIALAPGRLRIRPSGSAGGHNGIKSIIAALGSEADLADFVLSDFSAADRKEIFARFDDICTAAGLIVEGKISEAMNRFNTR